MYENLIKYTPIKQMRRIYLERMVKLKYKPSHSFIRQCNNEQCYAYIPWINNLGNRLIEQVSQSDRYKIIPLNIFENPDNRDQRRLIIEYSRSNPEKYRKTLQAWLQPVAKSLKGCLFTFDWLPVMRHAVEICKELGITTILIPHESVFFEKDKFYLDIKSGNKVPLTDWILGWGALQKEIFSDRGYPAEKIVIVGAPKFDKYHNFIPTHTREEFFEHLGMSPNKKTILFAAQTLDSQLDTKEATKAQQNAIWDIYKFCKDNYCQLIVRYPPSQYDVLTNNQFNHLSNCDFCFIENPKTGYLFTPDETIWHCDITASLNSTMLFEAMVLGRAALSVKYIDFKHTWAKSGIDIVTNRSMLNEKISYLLSGAKQTMNNWAIEAFTPGKFDGKATQRVISFLEKI